MVGVPATTHRRFANETHKHDPSRSRRWGLGYRRSRGRHRGRRRRAELHDEHEPIHDQRGDRAIDILVEHQQDAFDDHAEDNAAAGLIRSPVPEHGQVEFGFEFEFWLRLELGLCL
jgi:hypothetical protein